MGVNCYLLWAQSRQPPSPASGELQIHRHYLLRQKTDIIIIITCVSSKAKIETKNAYTSRAKTTSDWELVAIQEKVSWKTCLSNWTNLLTDRSLESNIHQAWTTTAKSGQRTCATANVPLLFLHSTKGKKQNNPARSAETTTRKIANSSQEILHGFIVRMCYKQQHVRLGSCILCMCGGGDITQTQSIRCQTKTSTFKQRQNRDRDVLGSLERGKGIWILRRSLLWESGRGRIKTVGKHNKHSTGSDTATPSAIHPNIIADLIAKESMRSERRVLVLATTTNDGFPNLFKP